MAMAAMVVEQFMIWQPVVVPGVSIATGSAILASKKLTCRTIDGALVYMASADERTAHASGPGFLEVARFWAFVGPADVNFPGDIDVDVLIPVKGLKGDIEGRSVRLNDRTGMTVKDERPGVTLIDRSPRL